YYATRERINGKGEGMFFTDVQEVQRAYDNGEIELQSRITVRLQEYQRVNVDGQDQWQAITRRVETTVGRALLSEILPRGLSFDVLNKPLKKKEISRLINQSFRRCGLRDTVIFADKLMQAGFRLATRGGISIAMSDMLIPDVKEQILAEANREVKEIDKQYS